MPGQQSCGTGPASSTTPQGEVVCGVVFLQGGWFHFSRSSVAEVATFAEVLAIITPGGNTPEVIYHPGEDGKRLDTKGFLLEDVTATLVTSLTLERAPDTDYRLENTLEEIHRFVRTDDVRAAVSELKFLELVDLRGFIDKNAAASGGRLMLELGATLGWVASSKKIGGYTFDLVSVV